MADEKPRPSREAGDRGGRPMGRRTTKRFVTAAILLALLFAAFTIYMFIRTSNDPEIQQGMEEYRRDTGQQPASPDTLNR